MSLATIAAVAAGVLLVAALAFFGLLLWAVHELDRVDLGDGEGD